MDKEDFRTILLQAARSPHGLLLQTNDSKRLRGLFYPIRQEEGLYELSFRIVDGNPEGNVQIEKVRPKGDRND